jgi:hypothetical protein
LATQSKMMADMNAPIAVFAYRRADHLKAMLETLSRCAGFGQSQIYIFSDGPKGDDDRSDVLAVRQAVHDLGWDNLELVVSDSNKGLKRSISEGVTSVVSKHGRVIVLEDDLHLSPVALEYFNTALDKYADEPRVWSISGYMYDVPELRDRTGAFFLPFAQSWGWATWERAWRQYDPNEFVSDQLLSSKSFRKAFSANGISDFARMLQLARDGRVSSWYIVWYYKIFREGGVSLFPPISLVSNRGFSGGTHAGQLNPYDFLVKPAPLLQTMVDLPDTIEIDYRALDVIPKSWEASVIRFIQLAGSIKRRFKYLLSPR